MGPEVDNDEHELVSCGINRVQKWLHEKVRTSLSA